jgi:hypothetical protein
MKKTILLLLFAIVAEAQSLITPTQLATEQVYFNAYRIVGGSAVTGAVTKTTLSTFISSAGVDWSAIINKPTSFTPAAHTHTAANITDFASAVRSTTITSINNGLDAEIEAGDTFATAWSKTQSQLDAKLSQYDFEEFTSRFISFNGVTIFDSASFTHNLNSTKIIATFIDTQGHELYNIDYYPDSNNTIKVYLPYRDKPTKYKFTGDLYVRKR